MSSDEQPIRPATLADVEWMAAAAADAFADDELWGYLVSGRRRHHRVMAFHRRLLTEEAGRGNVICIGSAGWAIWVPPAPTSGPDRLTLHQLWQALSTFGVRVLRARRLRARLAELRATAPVDHWYLDTVVVAPASQGAGIGSRLVGDGMGRVAQAGSGCYLEATGRRNAALYTRLGYTSIGTLRAGRSLEVIAMWAEP